MRNTNMEKWLSKTPAERLESPLEGEDWVEAEA